MQDGAPRAIRFTLNGQRYDLSRERVETRLANVTPETIHKHAVRVNGTWFPVIQAFEVGAGIRRSDFNSHTARRHLAALGYEIHGEIDSRRLAPQTPLQVPEAPSRSSVEDIGEEWHAEANAQAAVVAALAASGWRIMSVANTAAKEHGIDIIAARNGQTVGVEVKGYPSRLYADPARAHEPKRTRPSTQAAHWYSQAVLAAMRLRGKEPAWRSVIALPDFPRYRDLWAETHGSLDAAKIDVWWVHPDGTVDGP